MILKPLFRRHFWLTAIVFALFLSAASFLSQYLVHIERADFFRTQGSLMSNLVKRQADQIAYVKQLNTYNREVNSPIEVDVIKDGKSLITGEVTEVPQITSVEQRLFIDDINLPEPAKLVIAFKAIHGAARHGSNISLMVMLVAIVLASSLSIFLQFWSFRDKADMAKNVLTRMQQGDLKARFPTSRLDEVGQIMVLFNQMADEIERLVEQLKQKETARLHLLQELAHDLRTPVSSLRNLIETLRFDESRLQPQDRAELMELAFHESEYLTRLVEDLLFLAQVLEPKYKAESALVHLTDLIAAQLSLASTNHPQIQAEVSGITMPKITGNRHLIQRLVRNALENAFSFAKSKVQIELTMQKDVLTISFKDDGPGLSPEELENFGKKHSTRFQGSKKDGRISVGLGSVIIYAIATAHGGTVTIRNILDANRKICGAELRVELRANSEPVALG